MQNLKVTIVQTDLVWENAQQNRTNFDHKLSGMKGNQDIIVLPEMFNTAFCLDPGSCAEEMSGVTVNWLVNKAKELDCCIVGSILIKENDKFFNRLIWATQQGIETTYDKKHLFRFAGEHKVFSPGSGKAIVTCNGWKILPLVCFDLRFPVWSMNTYSDGQYAYDCIVYVANWPEKRRNSWLSLLVARAIENQAYVIGVNRIGTDGKGINHSGDSVIVDPRGKIVLSVPAHAEAVESLVLDPKEVTSLREHFPVAQDWDQFTIID
jgi:omega-amidase